MIDDLIELATLASADIAIEKASKRHRWVRVLRAFGGVFFVALVIVAIYVTIKYS